MQEHTPTAAPQGIPTSWAVSHQPALPARYLVALEEKLQAQLDRHAHGIALAIEGGLLTGDAQYALGSYRATRHALRLVTELLQGPDNPQAAVSHFKDWPGLTPAMPLAEKEIQASLDALRAGRSRKRPTSHHRPHAEAVAPRGRAGARK